VTYPPRTKKGSQGGLINKTHSRAFSQRVTVHNTKSVVVPKLQVVDRIPTSSDSQITVKLLKPNLDIPSGTVKNADAPRAKVSPGIVAEWYAGHDPSPDEFNFLGKDGKIAWMCTLPAQGKVDLSLSWEVNSPAACDVEGL